MAYPWRRLIDSLVLSSFRRGLGMGYKYGACNTVSLSLAAMIQSACGVIFAERASGDKGNIVR